MGRPPGLGQQNLYNPSPEVGGGKDGGGTPAPGVTRRVTERFTEREVLIPYPEGKRPIAYGRQRLAGKILFAHYNQSDDRLTYVLELCAGECDALLAVTMGDGTPAPLNGAFNAGLEARSPYTCMVWWYPGTAAGQVNPRMQQLVPTWNEALPGTCYAVVELIAFTTEWDAQVPNLLWEMRTRKCLDPATGTSAYSENAWTQWYDFVRWSEGKALPAARVNAQSFIDARAADEAAGRSMEAHPLVLEATDPDDIIKMFRLVTASMWPLDVVEHHVIPDRPGTVVATYDHRHVDVTVPSRGVRGDVRERPNRIKGWFTDRTNGWQRAALVVETPAVTAGLEDPVESEYELVWIHDPAIAKSRIIWLLNSAQFDFLLDERWLGITADRRIGDIVTRELTEQGLTFTGRLVARTKNIDDNTFDVQLLEYAAAKYNYDPVSLPAKVPSLLPGMTGHPVPNPVGVAASVGGGAWWSPAPLKSDERFAAAHWSSVGLVSFDATAINDGVTDVVAAAFGNYVEGQIIFDAGAGYTKRFRELDIRGGSVPVPSIDVSDDGSTWTPVVPSRRYVAQNAPFELPAVYPRVVIELPDVGAHRFWRARATSVAHVVHELQWREWGTPDPNVVGYRVYSPVGDLLAEIRRVPSEAEPLAIGAWLAAASSTYDAVKVTLCSLARDGRESDGLSIRLFTAERPPNPIDAVATLDVNPQATLAWSAPPVKTDDRFPAAHWSGVNLSSLDAAKINDGVTSDVAAQFPLGVDAALIFDAGIGFTKAFREIDIRTVNDAANVLTGVSIDYSDDGAAWTAITPAATYRFGDTAFSFPDYTARVVMEFSVGAHRFWRLKAWHGVAGATANISEVQWREWQTVTYPAVSAYRVYSRAGQLLATVTAPPEPGAPLDITSALARSGNFYRCDVILKTVNTAGRESSGIEVSAASINRNYQTALVERGATEELRNKTISAALNTIVGLSSADLSDTANLARLDAAVNEFLGHLRCAGTLYADSVGSNIRLRVDGAPSKDFGLYTAADGTARFTDWNVTRGLQINPDGTSGLIGTGTFSVGGALKERGRSLKVGEWQSATPVIAVTAGSWSTSSGTLRYSLVGDTMHLCVDVVGTLTGGPASLLFYLPYALGGAIEATGVRALSGGIWRAGLISGVAGASHVVILSDAAGAQFASGAVQFKFNASLQIQ